MSTNSQTHTDAEEEFADYDELRDRLDDLDSSPETEAVFTTLLDSIDEVRAEADTAQRMASKAMDRLLDLREEKIALEEEMKSLRQENDQLEKRIDELQDRTDLMDQVAEGSAMKIDKRAAVLIQTLYNKAWKNKQADNDESPTASMDYNKADGALGGTVARSSILRTFKKADDLVEDDVVRYISESRTSKKNSRLVLDLHEGEPPSTVSGQAIEEPEGGN